MVTFDKSHAARAWCVAVRLSEQAKRLGVPSNIIALFPENVADLELLEREIQGTARALSAATGIGASSLDSD
jgi:hypothetical protein